jgi:hypothetical protein
MLQFADVVLKTRSKARTTRLRCVLDSLNLSTIAVGEVVASRATGAC